MAVGVTAWGAASVRGTVRKQNEDRYDVKVRNQLIRCHCTKLITSCVLRISRVNWDVQS